MPTPIKYTPELIADLQARYNITATPEQLAAELGTPVGYLKTRISALRKDGFVFKYGKFVNEGETKVKTNRDGSTETFVRKNGKWEYIVGSYTGKTDFTVQRNRTKKYARKPRKRKVPAKIITQVKERPEPAQESRKTASLKGRNPTKHTRTRNPVVNTENPKDVRKKTDVGGRWVKIGHRTIVYRQNQVA